MCAIALAAAPARSRSKVLVPQNEAIMYFLAPRLSWPINQGTAPD